MDKKQDNFIRLAENRTNKIIDMLNLLGNLSNKSNYSYNQKQIDKIFESIQRELKIQQEKFTNKDDEKKNKFRL